MADELRIRQAVDDDMATILGLIDHAAAWLRRKGSDQWQRPWPSRKGRDDRVLRGVRAGHTWLVEAGEVAVATVSYQPEGSQQLWTDSELREPAVYLSRLVVRRSHAGQEIGMALIDWVGIRARRAWDARWIRVDVWTTNTDLHNYYKKLGFEFCRICGTPWWRLYPYPSGALFQKPASQVSAASDARFLES